MIVNESNTEQQDVEIKNQPQVDGNGSNQVTDPDPPIDVNKAFNYFKSSLEAAGKKTDEKLLYSYASRSDLKTYIREFHVLNGLMETLPNEQEADSIYNSWIDKSFVEKKKSSPDFFGRLFKPTKHCYRFGTTIHFWRWSFFIGLHFNNNS